LRGGVTLSVNGYEAAPGYMLDVTVIDTGVGFDAPVDDSLFEYFRQLDGSMTRQYGGLGIGLSLCKQLVELQGGTVSCQSEPGRGSRFQVLLPVELT